VSNSFQIVGSTNAQIAKALLIKNDDLEDNVQYILAKEAQCEIIVTNDKAFYAKSIKKLSSRTFVEKYLQ
jgi:predicted nucleic acid-binding protein